MNKSIAEVDTEVKYKGPTKKISNTERERKKLLSPNHEEE
jgi:hypothetical protein